ncbi:hypothetical protein FQA39_LY15562 [Lamprigera yunnana]|nr:hypothetical protein FQA39_LY15562 [Lamprigera yunnana]
MNSNKEVENLDKIVCDLRHNVSSLPMDVIGEGSIHQNNNSPCPPSKKPSTQEQHSNNNSMCKELSNIIFQFDSSTCFVCEGYFGPAFGDPTCAMCHAFLYPNRPIERHKVTSFHHAGVDSDSGNDEPDEINPECSLDIRCVRRFIYAPPVEVEGLEQQLSRLSTPQFGVDINIEYLPPEVLMIVFQYLDEISLWSVGQVCKRWKEILDMNVRPEVWRTFTLHRWPLLQIQDDQCDWYNVYSHVIQNCWCIKCIQQMAALEYPIGDGDYSWRMHRLRTELRAMRMDPPEGIQAKPLDGACCHWQATIEGPTGSPYEGGLFFLYIQIPFTYPMSPPVVRFLTKILHPNVSRHGDIGIDAIHYNWSLALTINKVLLSIQSLLTDPYCEISMERKVGELYQQSREEFDRQARLWTWRYAILDLSGN